LSFSEPHGQTVEPAQKADNRLTIKTVFRNPPRRAKTSKNKIKFWS